RRSSSSILAEPGGRFGKLHQERESERRERLLVERLASLVVSNREPDVIEHRRPLSAVVPYLVLHHLLPGWCDPWARGSQKRLCRLNTHRIGEVCGERPSQRRARPI